jgi:hypothetical protein
LRKSSVGASTGSQCTVVVLTDGKANGRKEMIKCAVPLLLKVHIRLDVILISDAKDRRSELEFCGR